MTENRAEAASEAHGRPERMTLTLLVRAYCHLCDEMRAAVEPLAAARGATLEILDVDAPANASLEAAWGDDVPVLFAGRPDDGRAVCRHHFDRARFDAAVTVAPRAEIR